MRFQCPACKGIVSVNNKYLGHKVQCGHCKEVVSVPQSRVAPGAVIADFIIRKELGRGGMGIVYLSHQISLDRAAALKVLSSTYANDSQFVVSFIREARAAARLNHPHIVQAYSVGEDDGIFYFAMENIDGPTMKSVLKKQQKIPCDQAIVIIQQIAEALSYAWQELKLIHRDIKPDNIMLTENGKAKLSDLGLASIAGEIDDGDSDEIMGTPQYISPEHLTGAPMDTRSDIYSLGATFYHFVTGKFPYEGKNAAEIARQHLTGTLIPPHEVNPDVPKEVSRIIVKMMARDPMDRYQNAEELIDDLRALHKNTPAQSSVPMTSSRTNMTRTGVLRFTMKKNASAAPAKEAAPAVVSTNRGMKTTRRGMEPHAGTATRANRKQKNKKAFPVLPLLIIVLLLAGFGTGIWFFRNKMQSKKQAEAPKTEILPPSPVLDELERICALSQFYVKEKPLEVLANCEKFLSNPEFIPLFPGLADNTEDLTKLSPERYDRRDKEKTKFRALVRYYHNVDEALFAKYREKLIREHEEAMDAAFKQNEMKRKAEEAEAKRKAEEQRKKQEAERAKRMQEEAVRKKREQAKNDMAQWKKQAFQGIVVVCDGTEKDFSKTRTSVRKFLTDYLEKLEKLAADPDAVISKPAAEATEPLKSLIPRLDNAQKIADAYASAADPNSKKSTPVTLGGKQMKLRKGFLWDTKTGKGIKLSKLKPAEHAELYRSVAEHEGAGADLWLFFLIQGNRAEAEKTGGSDPALQMILKSAEEKK